MKQDHLEENTRVYNKIAQDYSNKYFDYYKNNLDLLDKFLEKIPSGGKILDAGCASGGITQYLVQKGFRVTAIDISSGMLAIAKKNAPEAEFKLMDFSKLKFDKEVFDGIICDFAMLHTPRTKIQQTLKGFSEVLTPQGAFFISLYKGSEEEYLDEPFLPGEKVFWSFYELEEFNSYLEEAGFDVIESTARETKAEEEFLVTELYFIARKKND